MSIVGVYAPGEGTIGETEQFCDELHVIIDKINRNDYLIVTSDLNARVGNAQIDGVLGINGETTLIKNGQKLIQFASWNALKITNTLFRHKEIHKATLSARGSRSIIDYILVNKKAPSLVKIPEYIEVLM
jgi:hypothetical protein